MKGYFRRIIIYIVCGVILTAVLFLINTRAFVEQSGRLDDDVVLLESPKNPLKENTELDGKQKALLLYSTGDDYSEKLKLNIEKVCRWMKVETEALDAKRSDTVSYLDYDIVMIATPYAEEELARDIIRMLRYVENGGKLFWATVPEGVGSNFSSVYRKLGIMDIGDFKDVNGYSMVLELMPGCHGMSFAGEGLEDVAIAVQLEEASKVYVRAVEPEIPLIWSYDYGEGRSVFCNMTAMAGDYQTGMLGGCILALQECFMYPVLYTKTVFIDDFPSMQYNSDSTVIKADYNRTVKEFYRDIWWPDMQSAAKKYHLKYTGLFIATYDDIVNPQDFSYTKDEVEQYYGNSLIKNGFELGAHGYNHQSLTLEGGTPEEMNYNAWSGVEEMSSSMQKLLEITEALFPGAKLQSYVPPSNYLSPEGREAVVNTLEDLKVISGVYTGEGTAGNAYIQEFQVASDGVAEFPRLTAGMLDNVYEDFAMFGGAGLYGVFSHFIHPDDILDEERGQGLSWQELLDNFGEKIDTLNRYYNGMRALTASEAADALKIAYEAEVSYIATEQLIFGEIYNFYGAGYFYLKSERHPKAASDGCIVTRLNDYLEGDMYLVYLTEPDFVITLE